MASSTTLQGPRDDNIVPLLHVIVFLCVAMSVMLFVEKVYMATIVLVKLFRKRPGRHSERQYLWEPMHEKDKISVHIPMFNEKEVHQLSIGAACRVSWTSDRIIIQVIDADSVIKERKKEDQQEEIRTTEEKEDENERNQEEEIRTTEEKERRKRGGDPVKERKSQAKRRKEGPKREGRKRGGDPVEERKSQAKRRKEGPKREGGSKLEATKDEKKKAEMVSVGEVSEEKGRWKRRGNTLGERWKRGGNTLGERKSQAKRRKKAEDDEGRKKRKQQCRWVRSCMAMGCAAIFTGALIYLCAANIPEEETIYLVPT